MLAVAAASTGLAVQTGTLPGVDTLRRLQVAHSLWTSSPEVVPEDWPDFGVRDARGRLHAWYGIGQSLLFVPGDVAGTILAGRMGLQPRSSERLRRAVVAVSVYPAVAVVCVCAAYWWLVLLGFGTGSATAGACGLMSGTSLLYWTHGGQENSLLLSATLLGWAGVLHWTRGGDRRGLVVSAAAVGFALLVRIPGAALAFIPVLATAALHVARSDRPMHRLRDLLTGWLVVFAGFAFAERVYHYWRFGEVLGTYFSKFEEYIATHPGSPPEWPWGGSFWEGFGGQLWSPERSAFLFDPLLLLLVVIASRRWWASAASTRVATVTVFVMLVAAAAFHAKLRFWSGASAWGSRYVTVPAELGGCLAVALFARSWNELSRFFRAAGALVCALALVVQISSVFLDASLEQVQTAQRAPRRTLVVAERLSNLWAYRNASDPSTLSWNHYPAGVPHLMLFPWMARMYSASRTLHAVALLVWVVLVVIAAGATLAVIRMASTPPLDQRPAS